MNEIVSARGLRTRPPFSALFAIVPGVRTAIRERMSAERYRLHEPIETWREADGLLTVIDGHTRLDVARELGIAQIPVVILPFADEFEAVSYALHKQRDRRNWTDLDKIRAVEIVDAAYRRAKGGTANQYTRHAESSDQLSAPAPSREQTARATGLGGWTVQAVRTILDDAEAMEEVRSGVSISRAADRSRERKGTKRAKPLPAASNGNGHHVESLPGAATNWSEVVRKPRVDDQPWFIALNAGGIVESICIRAANEIRDQIGIVDAAEFDLVACFAERPGRGTDEGKVVTAWNKADRAASGLRLLVSRALRDSGIIKEDE